MKSPNTSILDNKRGLALSLSKGFTLIEIMIVVAIIAFLGVIGVIIGTDTYSRYIFRSDLDKVVALLEKARSSAINNVNEKAYGVYLDDSTYWVLFRGTSYNPADAFNYKVERSKTASSTNTCVNQIVFNRLTGNTTGCEIVIIDGNKVATTTINNQGGINY